MVVCLLCSLWKVSQLIAMSENSTFGKWMKIQNYLKMDEIEKHYCNPENICGVFFLRIGRFSRKIANLRVLILRDAQTAKLIRTVKIVFACISDLI